jgi:uncharacterized membrane protein (DUF106 family)
MPGPKSEQALKNIKNTPMPMSKWTMLGMVGAMIISYAVWMEMEVVGGWLNHGLGPLIGFSGRWPILTLIIAGLIMITLTTVIRTFMTDFVGQARNQKINSEFQKEMRQARLENNTFKLKKLKEEQPKMQAKMMESQTSMMKIMPITMIVAVPILAWIRYFLWFTVPHVDGQIFAHIPLGMSTVDLLGYIGGFIPLWMIIYMIISMPIGQLENRIVRYFMLKKRLTELDAMGKS